MNVNDVGNVKGVDLSVYLREPTQKRAEEAARKEPGQGSVTERPVVRSSDRVELSREVREINKVREQVRAENVREEKVAQVKKEIETGQYELNSKRTAYGIVRESIIDNLLA